MVAVDPLSTAAPAAGTPPDERSSFPALGALAAVAGLAVLLFAALVIRSVDTVPRCAIAAIGAGGLWLGLQRLGEYRFGRNFSFGLILSIAFLLVILFCTAFADWLPITPYKKTDVTKLRARPGLSWPEPLGRDARGGSFLSRVIYGGRVSLLIALLAVVTGLVIGCVLGLLSGYFGRRVEAIINVYINTTLAFPPLVVLFVIAAVFSRTVWTIGFGLAAISIPTYARIMRAQTLAISQREFITASRAMGASGARVMFKEILPNAILPVASYSFIGAAVVIIAEGSLAFLGLSVNFPKPTWGAMVAEGESKLKTDPHLVFVPAVVMFLTVLSLNRVGDWARKRVLGERNTLA